MLRDSIKNLVLDPQVTVKYLLIKYFNFNYEFVKSYFKSLNKPNAVFIWIPKTAGTSLWSTLGGKKLKSIHSIQTQYSNSGIITFGHMSYFHLLSEGLISKNFDANSYKFAIVRNPYDRAVSLYYFLISRKKIPKDVSFLTFCRMLEKHPVDSVGLYSVKKLSQCNCQVRWLENVKLDHIGRYENLASDVKIIYSKLRINRTELLPHYNKSTSEDYRLAYCEESKNIIQRVYKEDFVTLGYSFDL